MILTLFFGCGSEEPDSAPPDHAPSTVIRVDGAPADALGNALSAGDLNSDGHTDLLAAAYLGNRVCAVFGPLPAGDHVIDDLSPACWVGEVDSDYAGYGMAAVGDVSGDGVEDVMVGSIGNADAGANAGKAYLIVGPLTPGTRSLTEADAHWIGETPNDYAGITVGATTDLTGDGAVDLLVGASGYDGEGGGGGRLYLVAGPAQEGSFLLSDAYASVTGLGVPATPPPHGAFGTGDFVGDTFDGSADYDGDGANDLVIGASGDQTNGLNAGKMAIFFGPVPPGAWLISDADLTLYGTTEGAYAGSPVLAAPDLTGDGRADLLVSADAAGAGTVYLVSPSRLSGLTTFDEAAVTRFTGEQDGDLFGYALASGDADGDGAVDVVISGTLSAAGAGAVWVLDGPFLPGTVAASAARRLDGEVAGDNFGSALTLLTDPAPLLVVGARNSDAGGGFSGRVYLYSSEP